MYSLVHSLQLPDTVSAIDSTQEFIVAGSLSGIAYVWKVEDIKSFKNQLFHQSVPAAMGVSDCKFDPNGNQLFVSTLDSMIRKYQLNSESPIVTEIPADLMSQWKLDATGNTLLACGQQGKITIYDKVTLQKQSQLKGGDSFLNSVYQTRNGKMIAAGNTEGNLLIFNTEKNNKLVKFPLHSQTIRGLKVIESKLEVVTASDDNSIKIFDISKQQVYLSLGQHKGAVTSIDTHPKQDHIIISGGLDKTARIWDLRQKTTAAKLEVPSQIWSIRYWKTGRSFMVGTQDGTLSIHSL